MSLSFPRKNVIEIYKCLTDVTEVPLAVTSLSVLPSDQSQVSSPPLPITTYNSVGCMSFLTTDLYAIIPKEVTDLLAIITSPVRLLAIVPEAVTTVFKVL